MSKIVNLGRRPHLVYRLFLVYLQQKALEWQQRAACMGVNTRQPGDRGQRCSKRHPTKADRNPPCLDTTTLLSEKQRIGAPFRGACWSPSAVLPAAHSAPYQLRSHRRRPQNRHYPYPCRRPQGTICPWDGFSLESQCAAAETDLRCVALTQRNELERGLGPWTCSGIRRKVAAKNLHLHSPRRRAEQLGSASCQLAGYCGAKIPQTSGGWGRMRRAKVFSCSPLLRLGAFKT